MSEILTGEEFSGAEGKEGMAGRRGWCVHHSGSSCSLHTVKGIRGFIWELCEVGERR